MTHHDHVAYRLEVMEMLKAVKRFVTYRKLQKKTGISITELSRYTKGHVLPSMDRCIKIDNVLKESYDLQDILREHLRDILKPCIEKDGIDYLRFSISRLQENFMVAANLITLDISYLLRGKEVTKVLTASKEGVAWSSLVACKLKKPPVVLTKEPFRNDDLRKTVKRDGNYLTLYMPRGAVEEGDKLVFMDAFIRRGSTTELACNLTDDADGKIVGLYFLASIGDEWKPKVEKFGFPYRILYKFDQE